MHLGAKYVFVPPERDIVHDGITVTIFSAIHVDPANETASANQ